MKHTIPAVLMVTLLTACSSNTMKFPFSALVPAIPEHSAETRDGEAINGKWVCVLQPADASYFGELDRGSGNAIATKIREALRKVNLQSVQVSQLDSNAHTLCIERGAKRFLTTTIQHYEDRKTGFFGKLDRIEVKLSLYSSDDYGNRKSVVFEAKANQLRSALLEWGNSKPSALLDETFEKAVWKLVHIEPMPTTQADSFGLE